MEVNKAAWEKLRKQIEYHTQQDSEILMYILTTK